MTTNKLPGMYFLFNYRYEVDNGRAHVFKKKVYSKKNAGEISACARYHFR
jgi:hypothetical protein